MQRDLVSDVHFYVPNQFRVAQKIYTNGVKLTNFFKFWILLGPFRHSGRRFPQDQFGVP